MTNSFNYKDHYTYCKNKERNLLKVKVEASMINGPTASMVTTTPASERSGNYSPRQFVGSRTKENYVLCS
jgi:hypothetical protein